MAVDYDILYKKIAEYTEVLAMNRQSPVFVDLCEAYRQLGMLEDAANIARQGLSLAPKSVPGLVSLGRVLAQQGELPGAVDVFGNAVAIDGTAMPALTGLARVLVMQGNKLRAREIIQRAAQINPHDLTVKKILSTLGDTETQPLSATPAPTPAPTPLVEPANEGHLDPIATQTIAELYERQGLVERALKVYRDLLHKEPENELLRSKVARLQGHQHAVQDSAEKAENTPDQAVAAPQVVSLPEINGVYLATLNRWLDVIQQRRAHV